MSVPSLTIGFIPLVDAAPLVAAMEMGFAKAEGISIELERAPSWSSLRDLLVFGRVEAAHMLSPMPVAMALGLGGMNTPIAAPSVLSVNGNVIGISRELAGKMRVAGATFDFADARAAGEALVAVDEKLRIGVPFPFSMHAELLYYWLSAVGLPAPQEVDIHTIPPPMMAEAIATGEIDAFCVGEPWGSVAVEQGVAELLLPGAAIWAAAPEKVLAVREDWASAEADLLGRLTRAVWRAGRWLAQPGSGTTMAELLARPEYLDVPAEVIDRALSGRLTISPRGDVRKVDGFLEFHRGAATFPWRSQAAWMGRQLAARTGLDRVQAMETAKAVFRSDLHRRALAPTTADLPGASEKIEGSLDSPTPVASGLGRLFLPRDRFFDGRIFDPMDDQ